MSRSHALLLLLCFLFAAACRDGRRNTNTRIIAPDAGGFLDAGEVTGRDAGFATGRDAGFLPNRDGGSPPGRDGGMPATALLVRDLQDPTRPNHPGDGAVVMVEDVVVTAVIGAGEEAGSFYVQMGAGGSFSGILVFVPPEAIAPTVAIGDRVALVGTLMEYFDVTEIVYQTLLSRTPGPPLNPEIVSPDAIATGGPLAEAYEGVLVRVEGVQVTDDQPDFPDDFGEFAVTGGLRIDDRLFRIEPWPQVLDTFQFITGIHHHAFGSYKLLPRDATDVGPVF